MPEILNILMKKKILDLFFSFIQNLTLNEC